MAVTAEKDVPRHDPTLYAARGRHWASCSCGWQTARNYTAVTGAHLAFADHLRCVIPPAKTEEQS